MQAAVQFSAVVKSLARVSRFDIEFVIDKDPCQACLEMAQLFSTIAHFLWYPISAASQLSFRRFDSGCLLKPLTGAMLVQHA